MHILGLDDEEELQHIPLELWAAARLTKITRCYGPSMLTAFTTLACKYVPVVG